MNSKSMTFPSVKMSVESQHGHPDIKITGVLVAPTLLGYRKLRSMRYVAITWHLRYGRAHWMVCPLLARGPSAPVAVTPNANME